jgi:putative FmdB family regulatory protein
MPLYDFRCRACGAAFEAQVPMGTVAPCPECGAPDPERVLTGFSGPLKIGLRGGEAKRSDDRRRVREEQRQAGFAAQREERKQRGG